jgi:hypothetical protein
MFRKHFLKSASAFALVAMFATAARAHFLIGSSATAGCTGYDLTVDAHSLSAVYTIVTALT